MMKQILLSCATLAIFACNNEKKVSDMSAPSTSDNVNTLTKKEKREGWKLLFDGKTLAGWHKYGNKPAGQAWVVDDNSISLDSKARKTKEDGGDIVSDASYGNFDLKYDWKVEKNGNSGMLFLTVEDPFKYEYPYQSGPEMQVLDNAGHPDAKIIKHRAGDLYDLISSSKETVKPAMEWNSAEIKVLNGKLDMYLNGENVVSTMLWDDNWKALIAKSKFKDMKGWGMFKEGKFSLQDHGNTVWFRNIKVKSL